MKHLWKLTTLLAAVLMLAACDPDDMFSLDTERNIVYTVDADEHRATTHTDAEWDALLERFCNYAEGGSTVTFYNNSKVSTPLSKGRGAGGEATFSTTSREEMKAWMRRMEDEGKTVTVTYDSETGTWNGTAYANVTSTTAGCVTYATIGGDEGTGVIMTFDTVNHIVYITSGTLAIHFPTGIYRYSHSGDQMLLHYYYSIAASFEENLTITPAGGDTLDITYNYQGPCTADHTHGGRFVPTTLYTTLHCHNEAADVTLHIDRTNNTFGFGQAAVGYNDESMHTDADRPFSQGRFSYSLIDLGDYGLLWNFGFYGNLGGELFFDIENPGSNFEIWHHWTEQGTTEAYNPLRDFGFDRIN